MKKTNLLKLLIIVFTVNFMASCEKQKCECDDWQSQIPDGTFCYSDEGRTPEMLDYKKIVNMLRTYDTTRIAPLEKALGYEDSRINTYDYNQFLKYLGRIMKLSKKAGIEISGISFISAAMPNYNGTGKSYQDLIYIPTTTIDGKQVAFDPLQSFTQGKLVTFKEMLAKNGYNWIYNSMEEFNEGKREDYDYSIELPVGNSNDLSGAGNKGFLQPPY
ncbi:MULTISPECIES: hypothetical protein [unclassified Tenacibaculum]|uniref:hypothetical protein n=1 Tax=unclassified Tenacibaculum TaxID=2635139 RepID=UPI001F47C0C6|nr:MULTISPECIES: hypothetical protein [unclassified Tenacibaculum]MCF2873790.1 hypothetical protein [Tenacibaculum sp. Cn5-1]MCF2933946.1 hypothetical protein [Tenacibaculum sp. Cn5-34]MCG7509472.1 hypothetical protein [Tenacibaculum sp. Cn5-46]